MTTSEVSTNAIQRDIQATRDDIRNTLDALADRFSVNRLLDDALRPLRVGTEQFAVGVGDAAKENPIALTVTAIGLAWLMISRRSNHALRSNVGEGSEAGPGTRLDPSRVNDRGELSEGPVTAVKKTVAAAKDWSQERTQKVSDAVSTAKHWSQEKAEKVGEAVTTAKDWSQEKAEKAGDAVSAAKQWSQKKGEKAAEALATAKDWSQDKAHEVTDTAQQWATSASRTTKDVVARASSGVKDGGRSAGGFIQQHPIAVGAAVLGVGAALALIMARSGRKADDDAGDSESDAGGTAVEIDKPAGGEGSRSIAGVVYPTEQDRQRVYAAARRVADSVAEDARSEGGDGHPKPMPKPSPMGVLGQKAEDEVPASIAVGAVPAAATEQTETPPEGHSEVKQSTGGAAAPVISGKFGATTDSRPSAEPSSSNS